MIYEYFAYNFNIFYQLANIQKLFETTKIGKIFLGDRKMKSEVRRQD